MIVSASFRNLKSLVDVHIAPKPMTVIVGSNASGKTSILQALHLLSRLVHQAPGDLFGPLYDARELRSRQKTDPIFLEQTGVWKDNQGKLQVEVTPLATLEAPYAGRGSLSAARGEIQWQTAQADFGMDLSPKQVMPGCGIMGSAVFLHLDAEKLAEPSYSDDETPRVEYNGEGLASVLAHLALAAPDRFARISESIRLIVPSVRRIRLERARIVRSERETITVDGVALPRVVKKELWGHRIVLDQCDAQGIPAQLASEGTMLVLGLLTVLLGQTPPRLVLLDDIDRALHPLAQRQVIKHIREIQQEDPGLQVIASSHSPYLLGTLEPEEVLLTTLQEDGATVCAPLTAHPQIDEWRELMDPGEIWSAVGEDWLRRRS